jgi:hypothetical protein
MRSLAAMRNSSAQSGHAFASHKNKNPANGGALQSQNTA